MQEEKLDEVEHAAIRIAAIKLTSYHNAIKWDDLYQLGAIAVILARKRRDYLMSGAQRHAWLRQVAWGSMMDAIRIETIRDGGVRCPHSGRILEGGKVDYLGSSYDVAAADDRDLSPAPDDKLNTKQVLASFSRLTHRTRQILAMLLRGDEQEAIGRVLGITGSRVCQIKDEIVAALAPHPAQPLAPSFNFSREYISASNIADKELVRAFERHFAIDDETVIALQRCLEAA